MDGWMAVMVGGGGGWRSWWITLGDGENVLADANDYAVMVGMVAW